MNEQKTIELKELNALSPYLSLFFHDDRVVLALLCETPIASFLVAYYCLHFIHNYISSIMASLSLHFMGQGYGRPRRSNKLGTICESE